MCNPEIRSELKASKIAYWQVADELGIHENTVVRLMRHELSDVDRDRINKAIVKIKKKRG